MRPWALLFFPSVAAAQPETWTWEEDGDVTVEDRELAVVRFSPRFDVWVGTYNRPPRACRPSLVPIGPVLRGLRPAQSPDLGCFSDSSDEVAVGTGIEFEFRAVGPLYLTIGLDFLYTSPESAALKNQLMFSLPFGVMLTWYPWFLRPIAYFHIAPILQITDDARDFTVGGGGGIAYRILSFGSLSLVAGYHVSDTVKTSEIRLGIHPIL
jgi:hypothetical protein